MSSEVIRMSRWDRVVFWLVRGLHRLGRKLHRKPGDYVSDECRERLWGRKYY